MKLTEGQAAVVAEYGVYGCWLVKHCGQYDREHPIARAYNTANENPSASNVNLLFDAIDSHIKATGCEGLKPTYSAALTDLQGH